MFSPRAAGISETWGTAHVPVPDCGEINLSLPHRPKERLPDVGPSLEKRDLPNLSLIFPSKLPFFLDAPVLTVKTFTVYSWFCLLGLRKDSGKAVCNNLEYSNAEFPEPVLHPLWASNLAYLTVNGGSLENTLPSADRAQSEGRGEKADRITTLDELKKDLGFFVCF